MPNGLTAVNRRRIGIVVNEYPSVTETFVGRELLALRARGVEAYLLACTSSADRVDSSSRETQLPLSYGPRRSLVRLLIVLLRALASRPWRTTRLLAVAVSVVPPTPRGWWLAVQAWFVSHHVATELPSLGITHLHGHFLHLPSLVARLLAELWEVSFSASAHGRDIFVPEVRFGSLCRTARFIAVCSAAGEERLRDNLPPRTLPKLRRCYHGLDLERMPYRAPAHLAPGSRLRLASVCRLVPKKGVDVVLRALAMFRERGRRFSYRIVGDGPLRPHLIELATELELEGNVEFLGARPHHEAMRVLADADAMVMGCRVAEDGDRDGVPNAILEAMALGVPVVASETGGVSEVVHDGETGLLVPPDSPTALGDAIDRLAEDFSLRRRLSIRARALMESRFDLQQGNGLASLLAQT